MIDFSFSYYLRGTYRHVLINLPDLEWDFKVYKELDDQVIAPLLRCQNKIRSRQGRVY